MPVAVSHKWVHQVLKDRGIPSPGLEQLARALADCTNAEQQQLAGALKAIEGAVESEQTLAWTLQLLRRVADPKPSPEPLPLSTERGMGTPSRTATTQGRAKHHIYAAKAALTVELDTLRKEDESQLDVFTVQVEAAPAGPGRRYDWTRKLPFQFTRRELPLLAGALLGLLNEPLKFDNHGPEANKTFELTDQGATMFVKLRQGPMHFAVPIQHSDVYAWLEIVMLALSSNAPHLGNDALMGMLKRVAAMQNKAVRT